MKEQADNIRYDGFYKCNTLLKKECKISAHIYYRIYICPTYMSEGPLYRDILALYLMKATVLVF